MTERNYTENNFSDESNILPWEHDFIEALDECLDEKLGLNDDDR